MGQGLSKLEERGVILVGSEPVPPVRPTRRDSENWETGSNGHAKSEIEAAYFFENFMSYRVTNMYNSFLSEFQHLYKVNLKPTGCAKFDASDLTDSKEDKAKQSLIFSSKNDPSDEILVNEKLREICEVLRSLRRDPGVLDKKEGSNIDKINEEPMPSCSSLSSDILRNSTEETTMEVDWVDPDLDSAATQYESSQNPQGIANNENSSDSTVTNNEEQPTLPPKHSKRNITENGETGHHFRRSLFNRKLFKYEVLDDIIFEYQKQAKDLNEKSKFEDWKRELHPQKYGLNKLVTLKDLPCSSQDEEKELYDFDSSKATEEYLQKPSSSSLEKEEFLSGAESSVNASDDKQKMSEKLLGNISENFDPFVCLDDSEDADKMENQEDNSSENNSDVAGTSAGIFGRVLNKASEEECHPFVSSDDDEDISSNKNVERERKNSSSTDDSNGSNSKNMMQYLLSLADDTADKTSSVEEIGGNPNLNNTDRYSVFISLNYAKFLLRAMPVFFFELFQNKVLEAKLRLYKCPHTCHELSTTYAYVYRINENVDYFNYQLSLAVLVVKSIVTVEIPPSDEMLLLAHRLDTIYNFTNEINLHIMNINRKIMKQFNGSKNLFELLVLSKSCRYVKNIIELPEEIIRKCLSFSLLITKFNELLSTLQAVLRQINSYKTIFQNME